MDWSFCPSELAWGTLADYINAAVAVLVGIGVLRLGTGTNRLTQAANETNAQSAAVETAARTRESDHLRREGDLLLLYCFAEIQIIERDLAHIDEIVTTQGFTQRFETNEQFRSLFNQYLKLVPNTALQAKVNRAHVLEDAAAGRFLQLLSGLSILEDLTRQAIKNQGGIVDLAKLASTLPAGIQRLLENAIYLSERCDEVLKRFEIPIVHLGD